MAHSVARLPINTRWHHIHLDAGHLMREVHKPLKLLFERCYLQAGKPEGMALWFVPRADGSVDIYMSPQSVVDFSFMHHYLTTACTLPVEHMLWLAGDPHALFPAQIASTATDESDARTLTRVKPSLKQGQPWAPSSIRSK